MPPVSPDTWGRLARLDARCDMELRRLSTAPEGGKHATGRNYPRMWRVLVWETAHGRDSALIVEAATLGMALDAVVELAEQRGWHRPAAPPTGSPRRTG